MRNDVIREILKDPEIQDKYNIKSDQVDKITTSAPYPNKLVEVLAMIINENDNHLTSQQIYNRIKRVHNI